jgi:hypothetical protein
MLPLDVDNYLGEISRVIRKGGTCIITFFLLNEESLNLIHSGQSTLNFGYQISGCLTTDEIVPESAIAYNEELIKELYKKYGLMITHPIQYGNWCKRQNFLTYQDLIIAKKQS